MPLTLVTGPANAGKAQAVLEELRRHIAHGAEPILVVPTRADAEQYLRELAGERVAVGVRVERFEGLLAEAVRRVGLADQVLGNLARERLIEALAARAGAPRSVGFLRSLGELFAELQVRRVAPEAFGRALAQWRTSDGPSAAREELGGLYAEYRETLARLGRPDGEQRAVAALDALRTRPATWGGTPVLFYGFDDLTPLQLDAIDTVGRVVDAPVTVSLAYEPGRTAFAGRAATYQTLAPLAREHRSLAARSDHYAPSARAAIGHLERNLFEPVSARVDPGRALCLLEGGGERAELELVADEVAALIADGMEPGRIAVLVRNGGTSLDLLEEVFASASIPFATRRRRRFADTAIGRALLGALRCVPVGDSSTAGELADLLAWMRAPGLLADPSARGAELALVDGLELAARRSGVRSAAAARQLWEQRHWPLEGLDRLADAQERGPHALLDRAGRELERLFSSPRRRQARLLEASELDEARALAAGRAALAEMRELARSDRALAPASAAELARVLERVEIYSGAGAADFAADTVAVLDPLALRARRVGALFVCGLQEGVFPARARPEPLLSHEERRRLAEVSGLRLREGEDTLAAERFLLYAAVSRPEQRLTLSWHVADDDGETAARSLFVDDVCDLFDERLTDLRVRRALGEVGAARHAEAGPDGEPARPARRAGGRLCEERLLAELRERVWSASSLEQWIGCPVRWYVERMLAPDALEAQPEPLARGSLAHAALRDVLDGLREQTGSARVREQALPLAYSLLAQALEDNEGEHPLSVAPERLAPARRRLHADLERYLRDCAAAASPLEPRELELSFGFGEEEAQASGAAEEAAAEAELQAAGRAPLRALDLGDGLLLRGRIDRVDVSEDGAAVVYDYKGGKAPPAARWLAEGSLQVALYMLAVEQLLGLRVVGGFYQPLTGEDLRARGVLDRESGVALDCVRTDLRDSAELAGLLEEVRAAAHRAAAQAACGELEARPATCAFRGGCTYPAICRCER